MAESYLKSLSSSSNTFIGVHIRRTDYSRWLRKNSHAKLFDADWVFYAMKTAIQYTKSNNNSTVFVVSSDDFNWCKKNLNHPDYKITFTQDYYKEIGKTNKVYFDFAVLANCNHNIFQYGTFGFWSSFLSGGHTFLSEQYNEDDESDNVELVREIIYSNLHKNKFHFI